MIHYTTPTHTYKKNIPEGISISKGVQYIQEEQTRGAFNPPKTKPGRDRTPDLQRVVESPGIRTQNLPQPERESYQLYQSFGGAAALPLSYGLSCGRRRRGYIALCGGCRAAVYVMAQMSIRSCDTLFDTNRVRNIGCYIVTKFPFYMESGATCNHVI